MITCPFCKGGFSEPDEIVVERDAARKEVERLKQKLLTAAGDDLCRLTQDEIRQMSLGAVKIPPKKEFLASCERFHAQVAGEAGVMEGCLTLAQLVAETEQLRKQQDTLSDALYQIRVVLESRNYASRLNQLEAIRRLVDLKLPNTEQEELIQHQIEEIDKLRVQLTAAERERDELKQELESIQDHIQELGELD